MGATSLNVSPHKSTRLGKTKSKSYMQRLFFGKLTSFIQKYSESQDLTKTPEEVPAGEDHFGPILLDVNSSDIYQAWEKYLTSPLSGYEGASAAKLVIKADFISELPQILTFQLNRVKFDRDTQTAQKSNKEFVLPTYIFPDRFMLHNKQLIEGLRRRTFAIEQKLKTLKRQIDSFETFGKNKQLLDSFRDVVAFLGLGLQGPVGTLHNSQLQTGNVAEEKIMMNQSLYMPQNVSRVMEPHPEVPISQMHPDITSLLQDQRLHSLRENLSSFLTNLSTRHAQLEYEKKDLESKIARTYDGLEKNRYVLFSVIVHEGTAESGHYYCFVRLDGENWVKFNDYQSKRVPQQEVLEIARGGDKINSSAYCAFYMKEEEYVKSPPHNYEFLENSHTTQIMRSMIQTGPAQISSRGYQHFLSNSQKQKILEKNRVFDYVGFIENSGSREYCCQTDCRKVRTEDKQSLPTKVQRGKRSAV